MAREVKPLTVRTKRGNTREALVGMGDVLDRLTDLARAAGDCTPAWSELGDMWQQRQNSVFDTSGRGKWSDFSVPVIRRGHPLVDEGKMRDGMTAARPRYDDKHMVVFGPPKGNKRVQAVATLNTVGHRDRSGTTKVPPRPVVPSLTSSERRRWIAVIDCHIKDAID